MLKRLKAFRNKKGFTLIELMIVIAVIGILALVLIPKIGSIKTQAKTAGLDTNMRLVQAVVQAQITDYVGKGTQGGVAPTSSTGSETVLQTQIENSLNAAGDTTQQPKDPFNSWTGAVSSVDGSHAVVVATAAYNSTPAIAADNANAAGIIYVTVYPSSSASSTNDIWVALTPYDNTGAAILSKQVTIKP